MEAPTDIRGFGGAIVESEGLHSENCFKLKLPEDVLAKTSQELSISSQMFLYIQHEDLSKQPFLCWKFAKSSKLISEEFFAREKNGPILTCTDEALRFQAIDRREAGMSEQNLAKEEATVEVDELLNAVLVAALEEAKKKLQAGQDLIPFTALAKGDKLLLETHPAEDVEQCFESAEKLVSSSKDVDAYAFCYDGFVETEEGDQDVIIAEGGLPGAEEGHALGYFYTLPEDEDGNIEIESVPVYIGPAPNFMA